MDIKKFSDIISDRKDDQIYAYDKTTENLKYELYWDGKWNLKNNTDCIITKHNAVSDFNHNVVLSDKYFITNFKINNIIFKNDNPHGNWCTIRNPKKLDKGIICNCLDECYTIIP